MKKPHLLILTLIIVCGTQPQPCTAQLSLAGRQFTLNGYNLNADSFDSSDPTHSTNGSYDPGKANDQCRVTSLGGIKNSINIANVSIWGSLTTSSPYQLDMSPQSSIGSLAWHQAEQLGIEPGHFDTNALWQLPDVVLPFTTWVTPSAGDWEGEHYTYVLSNGDYELASLVLAGGDKMLITGAARLYVPDDLDLKGDATIRVLSTGSLQFFVGARTANIRGTGIVNDGPATNLRYFALANNTTINLRLSTTFTGLLYAPNAVCYLSAKGNLPAQICGQVVVQELDLGTVLQFHYDEATGH